MTVDMMTTMMTGDATEITVMEMITAIVTVMMTTVMISSVACRKLNCIQLVF
jgi:hypothetical protein